MEKQHTWALTNIHDILNPNPLRLEMGIKRNEAGLLTVATRTDLHNCKGRMLEWWFKFFETTQHIKWWHPIDHIAHHGWDDKWVKGENYIGASIHAVESLGDIPPVAAKLKFRDPTDFFDDHIFKDALLNQHVSGAVCASIGFGEHIKTDDQGYPIDGQMLHITHDTEYGCVLRSRFSLGASLVSPTTELPDELGLSLMRHCYNEFTYLSRFLPSLYYGEHANNEEIPLPW